MNETAKLLAFEILKNFKYVKIDIHFERLKFLDGHRSANFVYIRNFVNWSKISVSDF